MHRSKDVTTRDFNKGVTIHLSCRTAPNAGSERIVAATATEDFPIEGVAIITLSGTSLGVVIISEDVIHIVVTISVTIGPRITLVELTSDGIDLRCVTRSDSGCCSFPLFVSVGNPLVCCGIRIVTETYLTPLNLHMGVTHHQAVLGATIHGGRDDGRAADFQIGAIDYTKSRGFVICDRVGFTTATTKDITEIVVYRIK